VVTVLDVGENFPSKVENGHEGIGADAGSALAKALGFNDKLFHGWIEVCEDRKTDREIIYLHYINSRIRRQGNVTRLIKKWIECGFDVRIVRPEPEMINIIEPMGFVEFFECKKNTIPKGVYCEIWRIPA
jgi:hypothetical protein